jgi:tight adherence protein C
MTLLIAGLCALAAYLMVRAFAVEGRAPTSAWRDATFGTKASAATSQATGPALRTKSLLDRIIEALPSLEGMQAPAQRAVELAGLSPRLTGASLIGICAVLGTAGMLLALVLVSNNGISARELVAVPVVGLLGVGAPLISVSGRGKRRRDLIDRALPDVLDLLVVSVEAGLALESALQRISARGHDPLTQEIQRTLNEVALGRRRYDALISLGARCGVQPLQTLINAMNQAERSGMQLGPVLRAQSEQIRTRRRQLSQEKAMKAPLKMLLPLVMFIFPVMFLVILGPAVVPFIAK